MTPNFRCPRDRGPMERSGNSHVCTRCGFELRSVDGIFDLLPEARMASDVAIGACAECPPDSNVAPAPSAAASIRGISEEFGLRFIAHAHLKLLAPHLGTGTHLDNGCGCGRLLGLIDQAGCPSSVGIDLNMPSLVAARKRAPAAATLVHGSSLDLPFDDDYFDTISSSEVLEHIPEPNRYLAEMFRVLKPGGHCTLSTPNAWMYLFPHPWNIAFALRHNAAWRQTCNPQRDWIAALPSHPALRPSVLRAWCKGAGFRVLTHRGLIWNYYVPHKFSLLRVFESLEHRSMCMPGLFKHLVEGLSDLAGLPLPVMRCFTSHQIVVLTK